MADNPIPTSNAVCAHDQCSCVVSGMEGTVERNGAVYCSEGCARGEGCGPYFLSLSQPSLRLPNSIGTVAAAGVAQRTPFSITRRTFLSWYVG